VIFGGSGDRRARAGLLAGTGPDLTRISNAVVNNQTAYIAGWAKKLRDDRKLLIHAAAQALHAADYVLNRKSSK